MFITIIKRNKVTEPGERYRDIKSPAACLSVKKTATEANS